MKLYICTVFCVVYRCRFQGQRMAEEDIRAGAVQGALRVRKRGLARIALLLAPDGETYELPVLTKVKLLELEPRGLLLAGLEVYPGRSDKRDGPSYPQAWWCVPRPEPVSDQAARTQEQWALRQEAQEIGRTFSMHRRGR